MGTQVATNRGLKARRHHQIKSTLPSMLRRCSRQHRSQVQTCRSASRASAQVRRAVQVSASIRPQVVHTDGSLTWLTPQVSIARPDPGASST